MKRSTLVAGIGAALPIVVSTARGLSAGVVPTGDRAIIAARAYDVFTAHTPLVGQYSASTLVVGETVHSPGPLLYWLLALPARFGGPSTLALTVGLVNALAAFGCVVLARRRGGVGLMLAAAAAVILLSRSFSPETLHDIWNPSAALFPFTLLLFAAWSVACGEYRLLALVVVAASFAAQAELTYLAPSVGVLAVAIVGMALCWRARRPPRVWAWALVGVATLAVCWYAPVLDEFEHNPGNLTLLVRAATAHERKQGATVGWRAVVRAVGVPPWWLQAPREPFARFAEVVRTAPAAASAVSAALLLAALVAAALVAARRRRWELVAGAAIGLVLCAALGALAASTPTRPSLQTSLGYTLWWGSQAGMWVWLMLGLGGAALLARVRPAGGLRRRAATVRPAVGVLAGLVAVLGLGAAVAVAQGRDQDSFEYGPARTVNARVLAALPPGTRTVRVEGSHDFAAFDYRAAVIYALRRRGLRVIAPAAAVRLGSYYEAHGVPYDATVVLSDTPRRSAPGRVVVARVALTNGRTLSVTVAQRVRPRGRLATDAPHHNI